jgi:tetratricopeptide (TPR) repeat protein
MRAWQSTAVLSLAGMVMAAGSAAAQAQQTQQAQACPISFEQPKELKDANASLTLVSIQTRPETSRQQVQKAVGLLTKNPDKFKTPAARDLLLGRALAWWASQPGAPDRMTKGELGWSGDATAQVELLKAADSLFTIVESGNAGCRDEIATYRSQPWARLVNAAGPLIDAGKFDTASVLLSRANQIYRASPFAYYFQAIIAERKNDLPAAQEALIKTIELATPEAAKQDTVIGQVREYALYSTALQKFRLGERAEGEAKTPAMKQAADAFQAYLTEYPNGLNSAAARTGLSSALAQAGDTATIAKMQSDMATNPDAYSDAQLFEAGTDAFNAQKRDQAAKLFEAALRKNVAYRPALYNLTNTYFAMKQWDKMHATATKLLEVDPNNPDNWQLLAIAQEGLFKGSRPVLTSTQADSVRRIAGRGEALKTRVSFSEFSHDGPKHTLKGDIESTAEQEQDVRVTFEFLDATGQVVASKEAQVKVPARSCKGAGTGRGAAQSCTPGKQSFVVEVDQPGISAFRYQPVS